METAENNLNLERLAEELENEIAMLEMAAAEKKTRTNKQDVLVSLFSEPLILRLLARSINAGQSASLVREAMEKKLNEQPELLEKHGAKNLPLKIFHPEFLAALRTALEVKVEASPETAPGDVFRNALNILQERSQVAMAAMAKRKPKKSRRAKAGGDGK